MFHAFPHISAEAAETLTMWGGLQAGVVVVGEVRGVAIVLWCGARVHSEMRAAAVVVETQHKLQVRYVHPGRQLTTAVPYLAQGEGEEAQHSLDGGQTNPVHVLDSTPATL